MKKHNRNTEHYLPSELLTDILLRLPVSSLVGLKCVCKTWYGLINDPEFIKTHLKKSVIGSTSDLFLVADYRNNPKGGLRSFSVNQRRITGDNWNVKDFQPRGSKLIMDSCNGLLGYAITHKPDIYALSFNLYNPATRAYKHIPVTIPPYANSDFHPATIPPTLAYDCILDDYNIITVATVIARRKRKRTFCLLYSLKKHAWEMFQTPRSWDTCLANDGDTVFANNAVHWLFHMGTDIKCFGVVTRSYYEIQLPQGTSSCLPKLTVLKEKLHIVTKTWNIWVLKEYNDPTSWTLLFRPRSHELTTYFGFLWDSSLRIGCLQYGHRIDLVISDTSFLQNFLICCDLQSEEVTKVKTPGLLQGNLLLNVLRPWVDSLVPLHYM